MHDDRTRVSRAGRLHLESLESRRALAVVDAIAPEVKSVAGPRPQTYVPGDVLSFKVTFTEKIVVTGVPTLPIQIGDGVRQAAWTGRGSGGTSVVFTVAVQSGDLATTGVRIAGSIGLSAGAAIRDRAGNVLIPAASGSFPRAVVDGVGPRVAEFGDVEVAAKGVSLQVRFSEPVTVSRKPSIPFTLAGADRRLGYVSGSGGNVLTFRYQPARGEMPTGENVVVAKAAGIMLGRGRIVDKAGNAATSLSQPNLVAIHWATVGDKGNAADDTGYGAVGYDYRIGTYEITIGQYATFLNAVARTDTYGLYSENMAFSTFAGIARLGSPGAYSYAVMDNHGDSSNRPITFASWFDAARFANWMHNGQPTGAQGAATTEDGAYTLDGATWGLTPTRNPGALFHIPTENEWYKAAFYKGGGTSAGYWNYATQSDSAPGNAIGNAANQANCFDIFTGYAVTRSTTQSPGQNYLTDVGAFVGSASAYGTFDQCGNVAEWNDLAGAPGYERGIRGGSYVSSSSS
ncbi:MAG: formylglycine-generating enzyme family protein, partial [Planctomycetota bacterium]